MSFKLGTLTPEHVYQTNTRYQFDRDADVEEEVPIKTHGIYAYNYRGCRCEVCRQAAASKVRRRAIQRQKSKEKISEGMEG